MARAGLARYRAKRDFTRTREPAGGRKRKSSHKLAFVVQKHAARNLHYDFRLEWAGTLKSWAVPKGPSNDPAVKRLAVEVEDHPLEYASFEGEIAKGQYGAGHVERWDRGSWTPLGDAKGMLAKGHLEFELHGTKLRGRWHLVRTRGDPAKPQWLLFKGRDAKVAKETPPELDVKLTHPERVLFPDDGVTKLELARYFDSVAEWLLPQLEERPLSILRVTEGSAPFFQKHFATGSARGLRQVPIKTESGRAQYVVCTSRAGLLELAQLGAVELHTWGSSVPKPLQADRLTFDFDPDPELPWARIAEAALALRTLLEDLELASFAKTSGGKGLHVVAPLRAPLPEFAVAKQFALDVARVLVALAPEQLTARSHARNRKGKIFVDYLRNGVGATTIAAFSPRLRPGVPVSMPIAWDALSKPARVPSFTLADAPAHLASRRADPWRDYARTRQSLSAGRMKRLAELLA